MLVCSSILRVSSSDKLVIKVSCDVVVRAEVDRILFKAVCILL